MLTRPHRNFENGAESETLSWLDDEIYDFASYDEPLQLPIRAAFCTIDNGQDMLLAIAYRSHPVAIWTPLSMQMIGQLEATGINGVNDMVFNPNPETPALVISYAHGDLCLYNFETMSLEHSLPGVFADCLSCSMDGRTLVTGNSEGIIQVFGFSIVDDGSMILTSIYRIKSTVDAIRDVAFSFDGLRFVDIVRRQCRIWEPSALLSRDKKQIGGTNEAASQPPANVPRQVRITSPPAASQDGRLIIAGREDGTVGVYSATDGTEICEACTHGKGALIHKILFVDQKSLIVSASDAATILAVELPESCSMPAGHLPNHLPNTSESPEVSAHGRVLFNRRFCEAIVNIKANAAANRLLVSGHHVDELWELPSGRTLGTHHVHAERDKDPGGADDAKQANALASFPTKSSFQHPTNSSLLVIISGDTARVFRWEDFSEQTPVCGIPLQRPDPYPYTSRPTTTFHRVSNGILEHLSPTPFQPGRLILWPAAAFDPLSSLAGLPMKDATLDMIGPSVDSVLGIQGDSRLLFVDIHLWVCSTDLVGRSRPPGLVPSRGIPVARNNSRSRPGIYNNCQSTEDVTRRHFFALTEWRDRRKRLNCIALPQPSRGVGKSSMRNQGDINLAFIFGSRILIVEGGMGFSEIIKPSTITDAHVVPGDVAFTEGRGPTSNDSSVDRNWTVVAGSMHRRAHNF